MNDWESVPTHLIVLAYTTGDPEIFDLVEKAIKTMQQEMEIVDSAQGITVSETYTNRGTNKLNILQKTSLSLYKEIRVKMRSKGYLEINNFVKPRYENKPQMKVDQ